MPANDAMLDAMPFARLVGIGVGSVSPEEVTGSLDWAEQRCTTGGLLHGGALMSLADCLGAICAYLNLPDGAHSTTTVESSARFLRPLREGTVHGTARPLHRGRSFIIVQTELRDDARLLAQVTQTQAVLRNG